MSPVRIQTEHRLGRWAVWIADGRRAVFSGGATTLRQAMAWAVKAWRRARRRGPAGEEE